MPTGFNGLSPKSTDVDSVAVTAVPTRIDSSGAVVHLKMDTHETALTMTFPQKAHLYVAGREWRSQAWTGTGPNGHHREGDLTFAPNGSPSGPIRLVLDGFSRPVQLQWP